MRFRLLDRYLLRHSAIGALAVIGLLSVLVIGLELLLRLGDFQRGTLGQDQSRTGLIARWMLFRLPLVVSPLLPAAAVGGVLLALAPMLRRGELTALAACGTSLRRCCAGALALGLGLGVVDLALSDQIAPRVQGPLLRVEAQLTGRPEQGRIWRVPETGSTWFAGHAWLAADDGRARGVAVADGAGRLVTAQRLVYADTGWVLHDLIEEGPEGTVRHALVPASGWLALPYTPRELGVLLASRHALTGGELWRRGGRLNRSLALQRWLRLLAPLLAVACALPVFVRFANHDRLIQGSGQAAITAAVPLVVLALGGAATDNGDLPPGVMMVASLALAAVPALWLWSRWRD